LRDPISRTPFTKKGWWTGSRWSPNIAKKKKKHKMYKCVRYYFKNKLLVFLKKKYRSHPLISFRTTSPFSHGQSQGVRVGRLCIFRHWCAYEVENTLFFFHLMVQMLSLAPHWYALMQPCCNHRKGPTSHIGSWP
jgi:hypothetical protein